MTDETPILKTLHDTYCQRSGYSVPFTSAVMFRWNNWRSHGYDSGDLEAVISNLKRLVKEGRRWDTCLRFSKLIEPEYFAEELSFARAWKRTPVVDKEKASVLKATGRDPNPKPAKARSAEDIMNADAAFKAFVKLKDSL